MRAYTKITPSILAALQAIVGQKYVWTEADKLIPFEKDEGVEPAYFRRPEAVVVPASADEIAAIMKLANAAHFAVIPRGAGTGLEFGAVANEYGGIIVSTERLNRIIEINEDKLYMTVEPGVITADIQRAAKARGLLYGGDPCSGDSCFIGGNAATNAGGNRAVKYGTTRDQIYSLEVVTPTGDIAHFGGRLKKVTAGYPLQSIIIGSEGTLGIITKLTLKLVPLPKYGADILAVFPTLETALSLVTALPKAEIAVTCLECMDNAVIRVVAAYLDEALPYADEGHYMIIHLDGKCEDEVDEACVALDEICQAQGALEVFVADAEKVWKARKAFTEASAAECPIAAMEDFVVPPDELKTLLDRLIQIGSTTGVLFRGVSHAGDGNLHLDVLRRGFSADEEAAKIDAFEDQACAVVYALGGRISGEHGIGQKRKRLFAKYTDPTAYALMKAVKKAFDPNMVLNPGKLFE
ncbi:MAG: FAD-binding oxidoreductase [Megasphaera sp.]|nr:FAD-binding oxidoreductase [Megasphaera sp.]